jgi:hypothetical protein
MRNTADAQRAQSLATQLDLAISTARLASYFTMVGRLEDAREQRIAAQIAYDLCLTDWAALDMDTHADGMLRQKRADLERCLNALADGETC